MHKAFFKRGTESLLKLRIIIFLWRGRKFFVTIVPKYSVLRRCHGEEGGGSVQRSRFLDKLMFARIFQDLF